MKKRKKERFQEEKDIERGKVKEKKKNILGFGNDRVDDLMIPSDDPIPRDEAQWKGFTTYMNSRGEKKCKFRATEHLVERQINWRNL